MNFANNVEEYYLEIPNFKTWKTKLSSSIIMPISLFIGKCKVLLLVLVITLASFFGVFAWFAEGRWKVPYPNVVWSDEGDGYVFVSDQPLSLDVYILSLEGVGNYRAVNHSAVVDGALQACGFNDMTVQLDWEVVAKANMSLRFHMVSSWDAYAMLVEWGSNVIIVNTHDEYLPVPSGYAEEKWVDKIADFMLNRWGTWVHTGGYPLYRVWHENGTVEERGESMFQRLMSHVGKENITCNPPQTDDVATYNVYVLPDRWQVYSRSFASFSESNIGYPIDIDNFESRKNNEFTFPDIINSIYDYARYKPAATIFFRSNQTESFGIYVHFSPWEFYGSGWTPDRNVQDAFMGCVSTAAAVWADIGIAIKRIYGLDFGEGAYYMIDKAKSAGRTVGLDVAEDFLNKALDAFQSGRYKLAISYAEEAKAAAENATAPNYTPQAVVGTLATVASAGVGVYYYKNNKKNSRKTEECANSKQH